MRAVTALLWCPTLLAIAHPAECTQGPRLHPGARIRFDAPSLGYQLTGTLVRWESDTLTVQLDADAPGLALRLPPDSLTRLDVRRERPMTFEGMGLGVLTGAAVAYLASPDSVDENGDCTTVYCLAYAAWPRLDTRVAVLSVAGLLVGTIVGSATKTATWSPVQLQRVTVGATPDGGVLVGVSFSF